MVSYHTNQIQDIHQSHVKPEGFRGSGSVPCQHPASQNIESLRQHALSQSPDAYLSSQHPPESPLTYVTYRYLLLQFVRSDGKPTTKEDGALIRSCCTYLDHKCSKAHAEGTQPYPHTCTSTACCETCATTALPSMSSIRQNSAAYYPEGDSLISTSP